MCLQGELNSPIQHFVLPPVRVPSIHSCKAGRNGEFCSSRSLYLLCKHGNPAALLRVATGLNKQAEPGQYVPLLTWHGPDTEPGAAGAPQHSPRARRVPPGRLRFSRAPARRRSREKLPEMGEIPTPPCCTFLCEQELGTPQIPAPLRVSFAGPH